MPKEFFYNIENYLQKISAFFHLPNLFCDRHVSKNKKRLPLQLLLGFPEINPKKLENQREISKNWKFLFDFLDFLKCDFLESTNSSNNFYRYSLKFFEIINNS
jgi:hypothetical protein